MMRGEAVMALRDKAHGLARIPRQRLAWPVVASFLILTLPARPGANLDEAPSGAATPPTEAVTTPVATPAPGATARPAAAVAAPAPKPDDRQRRVLMLLLMNSAGPVRPYGNLGR
jgi:hypothetical protein